MFIIVMLDMVVVVIVVVEVVIVQGTFLDNCVVGNGGVSGSGRGSCDSSRDRL